MTTTEIDQAAQLSAYEQIRNRVRKVLSGPEAFHGAAMRTLGEEFIKIAHTGNPDKIRAFLDGGFPATFQDPVYGQTALHIFAAGRARKAFRILLKSGQCDYLIRDNQGRLASELAFLVGKDIAMARLLRIKERKQADEQGIVLTRRPK